MHRKRKAEEEKRGRKTKTRLMLSKMFLMPLNFLQPVAFTYTWHEVLQRIVCAEFMF